MMRPELQMIHRRCGAVLIVVTWVLLILAGIALVLAQMTRVELQVSANAISQAQADAVERGAEQFVLSQIDGGNANLNFKGDAATITQINCEAQQIGDGYFWILTPNPDNNSQYAFGITDEAGKINLNTASAATLALLPGMSDNANTTIPASIVAWRGNGLPPPTNGTVATSNSADQSYYLSLPTPYNCKNSAFETVEELYLVKGIVPDPAAGQALNTTDVMYGYDTNHNGMLEDSEINSGGMANQINAAQGGGMGMAHFVTVYSNEPMTNSAGTARVNVNTGGNTQISNALQKGISASRAGTIATTALRLRPFRNIFDFAARVSLTQTEFAAVADFITTSTPNGPNGTMSGLVNINTATSPVLACLPGLVDSDVQSIITKRQSLSATDMANVAWINSTLSSTKAIGIGAAITARSFQYSADIVGVSGDGRSFKRVKIVVDTQASPPKILFRKDLTNLGWPLDPGIRTALRAGQTPPTTSANNTFMKGGT